MKILKCITFCIAFVMLCGSSFNLFAAECDAYNWYCRNNNDHTQPILGQDIAFVEKYGAYYVNRKAKDEKVIYLTFDAGYENGNIEKIMNVMKENDVVGAFFILDNLLVRNADLVKRMVNEGHLVCNHTKKHPDMSKITDRNCFNEQLNSLAQHYEEVIGKPIDKYYRPPEGRFSQRNLMYAKDLGYKTVFWSFAYADWDNNRQMSEDKALEKILSHVHNGEIMLLHPTSATNAAIMDRLIKKLKADGYRFGTLDEL